MSKFLHDDDDADADDARAMNTSSFSSKTAELKTGSLYRAMLNAGVTKSVTGKQCKPRSDASERGVWSTQFALETGLIALGFNDTSTLVGHLVSSPRERKKRDKRDNRRDENLIELGFNDTSTLVGHFVSSPREREKRDRRDSRGDER